MLLMAFAIVSIAMVFLPGVPLGLYAIFYERDGIVGVVIALLIVAISALIGLPLVAAAAIAVRDFFRQGPLLIVDASSVWDRRLSDQAIGWNEVEHAKVMFTRAGPVGIRLRLRTQRRIKTNRLRIGCWGMLGRRDPAEVGIALTLLNRNPRTLAIMIADSVERSGGTVDRRAEWDRFLQPNLTDSLKYK
jgi:hypothetical protein